MLKILFGSAIILGGLLAYNVHYRRIAQQTLTMERLLREVQSMVDNLVNHNEVALDMKLSAILVPPGQVNEWLNNGTIKINNQYLSKHLENLLLLIVDNNNEHVIDSKLIRVRKISEDLSFVKKGEAYRIPIKL